jgi:hypothetical protein
VFHLDVAKLDMDVVYVFAMDFKYFQMFLDVCCKCFHLNITKIDQDVIHLAMKPTYCKTPVTAVGGVALRSPRRGGICLRRWGRRLGSTRVFRVRA